jgi:hypothetical protein
MPLTVSRWPQFPDPRRPWFGSLGCDPPTASPWHKWVTTTGATGPYATFNVGTMVEVVFDDGGTIDWESPDFPQVGWVTRLRQAMWFEPDPPTRPYTLAYTLEVRDSGFLRWYSIDLYTYPDNVLDLQSVVCSPGAIDQSLMSGIVKTMPRAYQLGPP